MKGKCITSARRPLLAVDCLLPGLAEGPLTRKPTLKLSESVAIYEPPAYRSKLYADQVFVADQTGNLNVREIGAIS